MDDNEKEEIDEDSDEEEKLYTIFNLNGEDYGISVEVMDEIVKDIDTFNVPASPEYLLGATNLRENVVPVIDLKLLIGLGKTKDGWEEVLLVRHEGKRYAMPVDEVKDMISPKKQQMVDPSSITNLREKNIKWMIKLDDNKSVRVLDFKELLSGIIDDFEIEEKLGE